HRPPTRTSAGGLVDQAPEAMGRKALSLQLREVWMAIVRDRAGVVTVVNARGQTRMMSPAEVKRRHLGKHRNWAFCGSMSRKPQPSYQPRGDGVEALWR